MTQTLTSPSEAFPAPPALALQYPDGWYPLPEAGLALAVAKTVPEGQFRPNVVVAVTRLRSGATLDQAVVAATAKLAGLDGYTEVGREHTTVSGLPGFRIEVTFADGRGATMAQALRLVLVDRGPVVDLVEMTGSCLAPQVESTWQEIRDIQSSLRVDA